MTTKALIIYFSLSGATQRAASKIQALTGADCVRLQRVPAYPDGYDNYVPVADHERLNHIHPQFTAGIPDLQRYHTILLGFPTWWQQPPMIIASLFDQYDFAGKVIVPFSTSMSTPIADCMPAIEQLADHAGATVAAGFRYAGDDQQLRAFLQEQGLLASE